MTPSAPITNRTTGAGIERPMALPAMAACLSLKRVARFGTSSSIVVCFCKPWLEKMRRFLQYKVCVLEFTQRTLCNDKNRH
jgi:hypothetical protein